MTELNSQPFTPGGRVTVHVPTRALYDLEAMRGITAQVLDKLGCGNCHSGHILDFAALNQFVVNPATLDVTERVGRF